MRRIKDVALYATLCFTLVMLTVCGLFATAQATLTKVENSFASSTFANLAFLIFVYSVLVGLSFLVFDIKAMNKTLKRVIHVVLNYALVVAALIMANTSEKTDMTMLVFAMTFVFIAVYFFAMLIGKGINKLGELIDSREK